MNYPTASEILAAQAAIDRDGPMAEVTMVLTAIAFKDPVLRGIVERLTPVSAGAVDRALITSCIVSGLNYGLRIGELREAGKAGHG